MGAYAVATMKLWGTQESAMGACGQLTQSVKHVVVHCVVHKVPDCYAGLRRLDAATRTWLKELKYLIFE